MTERMLLALPGRRSLWIAAWALVPWLNAGANLLFETGERSAVWEQGRSVVIVNYAALSLAVVVALLGTRLLRRRVAALDTSWTRSFTGMDGIRGPVLGATATALAFGISALVADGLPAAVLRAATWFILGIAFWGFLWTYGMVQLGLIRLGQERLLRGAAAGDPGLQLRPLGAIAFMGLWLLLAWMLPPLVTGFPDVVGLVLGLVLLVVGIAAFVASLWRMHRQIVAVKENQLALARRFYAEAYEPLCDEQTLDALERQHSLLGAADALEKRALAIHEWPVAEGTWAWLIGIATSVVAIACARLILRPLGF